MSDEIEALEARIAEAEARRDTLAAQLEQAEQALAAAEADLAAREEEASAAEAAVESAAESAAASADAVAAAEQRLLAAEEAVAQREAQVEAAALRLETVAERLEAARRALDDAEQALEEAEAELDEADEEADEAADEMLDAERSARFADEAVEAAGASLDDAGSAERAAVEAVERAETAARDAEREAKTAADAQAAAADSLRAAEAEAAWASALAQAAARRVGVRVLGPYADYRLAGDHQCLRFTRWYSTARLDDGPLGRGWRHGWQFDVADHGMYVALVLPDGGTRLHRRTPDGLAAAPGDAATLAALAGGWLYTDRWGYGYRLAVDGRIQALSDDAGDVLAFEWADGLLVAVRDAYGRALRLDYDGGRLVGLAGPDAAAPIATYAYDGDRLVAVTDATGRVQTFGYEDARHPAHVTHVRYGAKLRSRFEWDAAGRLAGVADADGAKTVDPDRAAPFAVDPSGHVLEYEDLDGNRHRRTYDDAGRLRRSTEFAGTDVERSVELEYASNGLLAERSTPSLLGAGRQTLVLDHDVLPGPRPNARPTREVHRVLERGFTLDADGRTVPWERRIELERNARGQLVRTVGPAPGVVTLEVGYWPANAPSLNDRGQIRTHTTPAGTTTYSHYDRFGQPCRIVLPDGGVVEHETDAAGRPTRRTGPEGTVRWRYAPSGRLSVVSLLDGTFARYETDDLDRVTAIVVTATDPEAGPAGALLRVDYALTERGERREATVSDAGGPRGTAFRVDWNDAALVARTYQPRAADGSLSDRHTYTPLKRRVRIDHADGHVSVLERNARGALVGVRREGRDDAGPAAPVRLSSYERAPAGPPILRRDAEGNETAFTYDDRLRLCRLRRSWGAEHRFLYDEAGFLVERRGPGGSVQRYRRDALGRVLEQTTGDPADRITARFDDPSDPHGAGRLASVATARSRVDVRYAADGQVAAETLVVDGVAHALAYARHTGGALRRVSYPSGMAVVYETSAADPHRVATVAVEHGGVRRVVARDIRWHPLGAVDGLTFGNGLELDVRRDAGMAVERIRSGPIEVRYERRADNLLRSAMWGDGRVERYTYDLVGRLRTAVCRNGDFAFDFDAAGNLLRLTRDGAAVTHAYRGEQITALGGTPVEHDEAGNRTVEGGRRLRWDGWSRLVAVTEGASTVASYHYDGFGRLCLRETGDGRAHDVFAHFGELLAEVRFDAAGREVERREFVYLGRERIATVVHRAGAIAVRFHHADVDGRCMATTDEAGAVVRRAEYTPLEAAEPDPASSEDDAFRVRHHYADPATGYHSNFARWYDPASGRYLSPDPAVETGDLHPYLYARGNARNFVDLYGLESAGGCFVPGMSSTEIGDFVHKMVQGAFVAIHGTGVSIESPAIPGAGRGGGYGYPDVVLYLDRVLGVSGLPAEIYEIKPVNYRPGSPMNEAGLQQLERYVVNFPGGNAVPGVSMMGPLDYQTFPFPLNAWQNLRLYTYPSDPGMIYYGCVLRPPPEPVPVPVLERVPVPETVREPARAPDRELLEEPDSGPSVGEWILIGLAGLAVIVLSGGSALVAAPAACTADPRRPGDSLRQPGGSA